MGIENKFNTERPADEGTPCFKCSYGHGQCADAIMGNICIDYNMITKEEAEDMDNERIMAENRLRNILNNFWRI